MGEYDEFRFPQQELQRQAFNVRSSLRRCLHIQKKYGVVNKCKLMHDAAVAAYQNRQVPPFCTIGMTTPLLPMLYSPAEPTVPTSNDLVLLYSASPPPQLITMHTVVASLRTAALTRSEAGPPSS